jgi:hypothetical protein
MPRFRIPRDYPVVVLCVVTLAFLVWLWRDAVAAPLPTLGAAEPAPVLAVLTEPMHVAPPPVIRPAPREVAQVLSQLKTGMTRAEVEVLVGVPEANDIQPATVSGGRVTYRTCYEAELEPAPAAPKGRTLVTLEFDASKPGHPLLGIHYPNPRF